MKGSITLKDYRKSIYHGKDVYDNGETFWYLIVPLNYTWGKTFEICEQDSGNYEVTGELYICYNEKIYKKYLREERKAIKNEKIHYYFFKDNKLESYDKLSEYVQK